MQILNLTNEPHDFDFFFTLDLSYLFLSCNLKLVAITMVTNQLCVGFRLLHLICRAIKLLKFLGRFLLSIPVYCLKNNDVITELQFFF